MKASETTLIALEDGRAVVSTEGLFRIVKMPDELIVGELADTWEVIGQITRDGYGRHGAWRIAMAYELCRIVERKGISLIDIAIQPIGKGCCPWCGAHGEKKRDVREFECGTTIMSEKPRDGVFKSVERTADCEEGERDRREMMVRKSAALREVLVNVGVDALDGRPAQGQFVLPAVLATAEEG